MKQMLPLDPVLGVKARDRSRSITLSQFDIAYWVELYWVIITNFLTVRNGSSTEDAIKCLRFDVTSGYRTINGCLDGFEVIRRRIRGLSSWEERNKFSNELSDIKEIIKDRGNCKSVDDCFHVKVMISMLMQEKISFWKRWLYPYYDISLAEKLVPEVVVVNNIESNYFWWQWIRKLPCEYWRHTSLVINFLFKCLKGKMCYVRFSSVQCYCVYVYCNPNIRKTIFLLLNSLESSEINYTWCLS